MYTRCAVVCPKHIYTKPSLRTTAAVANRIDGKFGPFGLNGTRYAYIDRRLQPETVRRKRKTMASLADSDENITHYDFGAGSMVPK